MNDRNQLSFDFNFNRSIRETRAYRVAIDPIKRLARVQHPRDERGRFKTCLV